MKTIEPIYDYIFAEPVEEIVKKNSAIYLPDSQKDKEKYAKVVAIGPSTKYLEIDDKIIYKDFSVQEVKLESKVFILIKEEDVFGKVVKKK